MPIKPAALHGLILNLLVYQGAGIETQASNSVCEELAVKMENIKTTNASKNRFGNIRVDGRPILIGVK